MMEKDRGFNFKLLVPPRVNSGQISAVRPQEMFEDNNLNKGYGKSFDRDSQMPFHKANVVGMAEPNRPDVTKIRVVPPMEKEDVICKPGKLYSKLFDEVEKIKCWKVMVDSETVQKERKLQENKRTIETQRKAIQELQFGNENLSIKLEGQICENKDLNIKNNATRNLCNILKDTFQQSAEKIHLFESERQETHCLFTENSEHIKRMISAFESLRVKAESDQHEMQKVKENLLQFEKLKSSLEIGYNLKQEEVVMLQQTIKNKECELQKLLGNLQESQESCKNLQEAAMQHKELLKNSKQEQESLLQKLTNTEQLYTETEERSAAFEKELAQNKEEYANIILSKDNNLQDLNQVKAEQAEKLVEIQATVQDLQASLAVEIKLAKELELRLMSITDDLEIKNTELGELKEQTEKKDGQIHILEEELDCKCKSLQLLTEKIDTVDARVLELSSELAEKNEEIYKFQNKFEVMSAENNMLEKACESAEKENSHLKEETHEAEAKVRLMEGQLSAAIKKYETSSQEAEQLKSDSLQQEVKYNELLTSLHELQLQKENAQGQIENGSVVVKTLEAHLKEGEANEIKLTNEIQRVNEENHLLRENINLLNTKILEQAQETEDSKKIFDESNKDFKDEIAKKEKHVKTVETKLANLKTKFEAKSKTQEDYQKENKHLKKRIAQEIEKSNTFEDEINKLKEELQNLQQLNEEECKRLNDNLENKLISETKLWTEVQNIQLQCAEAIKSKEDAELKCQHKIADMVVLMEKHKNQYEKMVEDKDAELEEKKKQKLDTEASTSSLELELSKNRLENCSLKEQLKKETTEREVLLQEIQQLRNEMSSLKVISQLEAPDKKLLESKAIEISCSASETPKAISTKRHIFEFCKGKKTPSHSKKIIAASTPKDTDKGKEVIKTPSLSSPSRSMVVSKIQETKSEALKTPSWSTTMRMGQTPKIKSYRIRTPPSNEKSLPWSRTPLELDPKSDSSEHNDLLTFAGTLQPFNSSSYAMSSVPKQQKGDLFRRIQSPSVLKSPGNALKLSAMKRMRDAGWTAVISSDKKKKKKASEKIFA